MYNEVQGNWPIKHFINFSRLLEKMKMSRWDDRAPGTGIEKGAHEPAAESASKIGKMSFIASETRRCPKLSRRQKPAYRYNHRAVCFRL